MSWDKITIKLAKKLSKKVKYCNFFLFFSFCPASSQNPFMARPVAICQKTVPDRSGLSHDKIWSLNRCPRAMRKLLPHCPAFRDFLVPFEILPHIPPFTPHFMYAFMVSVPKSCTYRAKWAKIFLSLYYTTYIYALLWHTLRMLKG